MIELKVKSEAQLTQEQAALMAMQMEGLPKEKMLAMKAYALETRKRFPKMKPARVQKRVCEKFNVTLV